MTLLDRLRFAWAAFRNARHQNTGYAVIYDSLEFGPNVREEYYEAFSSPEEAEEMFRSAYPAAREITVEGSERLVLILGPIDEYRTIFDSDARSLVYPPLWTGRLRLKLT